MDKIKFELNVLKALEITQDYFGGAYIEEDLIKMIQNKNRENQKIVNKFYLECDKIGLGADNFKRVNKLLKVK
mgnify:CR=1 FL=1